MRHPILEFLQSVLAFSGLILLALWDLIISREGLLTTGVVVIWLAIAFGMPKL